MLPKGTWTGEEFSENKGLLESIAKAICQREYESEWKSGKGGNKKDASLSLMLGSQHS